MKENAVYECDLLYPTENVHNPGSIHITLNNPVKAGKMPVIIEPKTIHSPIGNLSSIIHVMQSEIFDRIHIDIKKNILLYIDIQSIKDLQNEYEDKKYLLIKFDGDYPIFEPVDCIVDT